MARLIGLASIVAAAACGGGGGGGGGGGTGGSGAAGSSGTGYVSGVFLPAAQFKGLCQAPRPGNNQDRPGRTLDENLWLRSWTNETYLWYAEVADSNPGSLSTAAYFERLKTPALTASGRPKDRFHFTYDTAQWRALAVSGTDVGHGIEWQVVSGQPPRRIVVAYTHPNEPASRLAQPVLRGEELVAINGTHVDIASATLLSNALFPSAANITHTFTLRSPSGTTRSVSLTSESVTLAPVLGLNTIPTDTGAVGYLQFNDHLAQSELALVNAIATLRDANVADLILDMRYNGGGYLDIAAELAFMVAGAGPTAGRAFEHMRFNDKHPTTNPVTGATLQPTPFYTHAQNFSAGTALLPTLNLSRVFILSGPGTCSASESLINGLRGVGVQVHLIGSTTCGKPYGFYATDNCGTTYFTVQMQTVNDVGFGDYADGFSPANTPVGSMGYPVSGCSVADDFAHPLGNEQEGRLAAALAFRETGMCPIATGAVIAISEKRNLLRDTESLRKNPLREQRWYR